MLAADSKGQIGGVQGSFHAVTDTGDTVCDFSHSGMLAVAEYGFCRGSQSFGTDSDLHLAAFRNEIESFHLGSGHSGF